MKLYLDNCCFNRPYDDQSQLKIFLESQAKLRIQNEIIQGAHTLVWSYILEYENEQNPFDVRKHAIGTWRDIAKHTEIANPDILTHANSLLSKGIKQKDALHIACAVYAGCDVFLTTDKKLLKTPVLEIKIQSPMDFVMEIEE